VHDRGRGMSGAAAHIAGSAAYFGCFECGRKQRDPAFTAAILALAKRCMAWATSEGQTSAEGVHRDIAPACAAASADDLEFANRKLNASTVQELRALCAQHRVSSSGLAKRALVAALTPVVAAARAAEAAAHATFDAPAALRSGASFAARLPTVLVLSEALCGLPLENAPFLSALPVCRMPTLCK
jgi:hypothetical protein